LHLGHTPLSTAPSERTPGCNVFGYMISGRNLALAVLICRARALACGYWLLVWATKILTTAQASRPTRSLHVLCPPPSQHGPARSRRGATRGALHYRTRCPLHFIVRAAKGKAGVSRGEPRRRATAATAARRAAAAAAAATSASASASAAAPAVRVRSRGRASSERAVAASWRERARRASGG
jgi:pyruvate/2-oxoglutarate dehydrogenase complex dihydrolipoamide acyltransferase (E2) component